jgi:hypothetical protein
MTTLQAPIRPAAVLAQLLDRLDASPQPADAHQYRMLAARLGDLLANPEVDWRPLLSQSPAAAGLYENLHYAEAGLCRSPLDQAMGAEMAARKAIEVARRPVPPADGRAAPDAAAAA